MNRKILKRDLKRKKSMNFILLLFVMLATIFIGGSVSNLKVVTGGLDYYFEKAGIGDFVIATIGDTGESRTENIKNIERFLEKNEYVNDYDVDDMLVLTENRIETTGSVEIAFSSSILLSGVEAATQTYFDEDNEELSDVREGEVYVPIKALSDTLKIGDSFYVKTGNDRKKFTIKGIVKDALAGSEMSGMYRFIMAQKDIDALRESGEFALQKIYSIDCTDVEKFSKDLFSCDIQTLFAQSLSVMKMTYIMDMIIAVILLVISGCLIVISAIMLRFTIIFTIGEDYKEIGIMKAIGIPDFSIRTLYITKYFVISVAGAVLGYFLSIPFGQILVSGIIKNIVVEDTSSSWLLALIFSALGVLVIIGFAFLSTGKIKKLTPMDAIRSGNNGERFEKKNILKLSRLKIRPTSFMAANDVLCELRKYIILVFSSIIGVWLVVMPVNTINTLQSEEVSAWFGMAPCDFYLTDQGRVQELALAGDRAAYENYLAEVREELEAADIPVDHMATETVLRYKIRRGDYSYSSLALQGIGTDTEAYMYEEGMAPKEKNEIAITHIIADKIEARIGDTVYISMFGEERPFVVSAIYQSMNNMGEGIRFAQDAKIDFGMIAGSIGAQIVLKDSVKKEETDVLKKKIEDAVPGAEVETTKEFMGSQMGSISAQIKPLKTLVLVIVIVINVLIIVLMQKMFLIREQGEMAMLKAVGFSNASIIGWQTKRIALVLFFGILFGVLTGTPFSQITSGEVFKMMGCSRITFQIRAWEVYVLYPLIIYVATIMVCILTMLKVKKISVTQMEDE